MKKILLALALGAAANLAQAALKPGDSLTPYEIKNVSTGKQYCQVCAYGAKAAKVVAFGKLNDAAFWADLKTLQELHTTYKNLGVFAQVIDSADAKAIQAAAAQHGITFPVVVAVEKDWDKAYKVEGNSRTIYYAQKNKIAWTTVGLSETSAATLKTQVQSDLKS